MAPYKYKATRNPLVAGGLSHDLVQHILAVGGPKLLKEVMTKAGKGIATALHPDVLSIYCKTNGIPYDSLAEALGQRSSELVNAKRNDGSELERLARDMQVDRADRNQTNQAEQLQREVSRINKERERLSEAYNSIKIEHDQLRREYELLHVELEQEESSFFNILTGKSQTRAMKRQLASAKKELEELRKNYQLLDQEAQNVREIGRKLETKLQATENRIISLENDIRRAKVAIREKVQEHQDLDGKYKHLQRSYELLQDGIASAESMVRSLLMQREIFSHTLRQNGFSEESLAELLQDNSLDAAKIRINTYTAYIERDPKNPLTYLLLAHELLQKTNGKPRDGEEQYTLYTLYKAAELGATEALIDLAILHINQGQDTAAEFILAKLVQDNTSSARAYKALAYLVRQQNAGESYKEDREQWARWLEYQANEMTFKDKISSYNARREENDSDVAAYIGIVETLLDWRGIPFGAEEEFAKFAVYKAAELGATEHLITLAKKYTTQKKYPSAEFILAKLVEENTQDSSCYKTLASLVREQNVGATFSEEREHWAKWLLSKA